jgi:hypothetical protein
MFIVMDIGSITRHPQFVIKLRPPLSKLVYAKYDFNLPRYGIYSDRDITGIAVMLYRSMLV